MEEGQNIYFLAPSFLGHGFSVGVSQLLLDSLFPATAISSGYQLLLPSITHSGLGSFELCLSCLILKE